MITINREKGYIIVSRCEYLYRDGLENRDEKAAREMGDGDIIIPLPPHMVDKSYDHTGRTDGMNAVTIIEEIARRLSVASEKLNENIKSAREWGDVLVSKGRQSEAAPYYWMAAGLEEFRNELSGQNNRIKLLTLNDEEYFLVCDWLIRHGYADESILPNS